LAARSIGSLFAGQTFANTVGVKSSAAAGERTEGLEAFEIDDTLTLDEAATKYLTAEVPEGAIVLTVQANLDTLIRGNELGDNELARVGIGTTGNPSKYGITDGLTKNEKVDALVADWTPLTEAEQIAVRACNEDGDPCTEKFRPGGIVRVRVTYLVVNSLYDAT
jgi:hypothetical protein